MVKVFIHSAEEAVIVGDDISEVRIVKTALDNLGIIGFLNKLKAGEGEIGLFDSELCGKVTVKVSYEGK